MVKKVSKTKRCKMDKLLMVLCSLVILIIAIAIVLYIKNENKISNAQNGMSEYLKNKYKEDFKVERPEHKHGGFGVNGIWMSQAYLVSNPKLKFDIDCSYLNPSDCSDQYIAAIWSVQASKGLESIVKEVNASSSNGYKADSARAEIILSGKLVNSVNKQSKYEDNKTKDEGFLYRLIIDAPNDSQKTSYIFKIVEKLREEGVYSVKINTNSKSRSTGRCTIFLDKKDLGSEKDLNDCINKIGE
ncbi:hypothetical protein LRM48_003075 [Candidatus Nanosynbacter sp. TM7-008]|uniref:hypothetical protein n=1 Tax=Candidatus Nanosynbacter sp. TM7-008 TaxID=2902632 RepID=UPI001FB808CC|nr:hypothetical protein [Candidatus Nanosynbacter sp. TM7-008]MCJ1964022.1 hypothetical protein [Candidatus Nanosynbacter sp. TM7-008]